MAPLHPWSWPWARVHTDYTGPFEGKMFFVLIDTYSKWLEVHMTSSNTSMVTVELMRKLFSKLGYQRSFSQTMPPTL